MARKFRPFGMPDTPYDPKTGKYLALVNPQTEQTWGTLDHPEDGDDPGGLGTGPALQTPDGFEEGEIPVEHTADFDLENIVHGDEADIGDRVIVWREKLMPQKTFLSDGTTFDQLVYKRVQIMASDSYHEEEIVGELIRIDELMDVAVDVTSIVDGHGLRWNESRGLWENGAVAGAATDPEGEVETLGAADEGSEEALTDTWVSGDTNAGLDLWFVARVVYNHLGDKILYKFLRKATYDTNGALWSISAETRVIVDTTEEET